MANTQIQSEQIADDAVTSSAITNNAVTAAEHPFVTSKGTPGTAI